MKNQTCFHELLDSIRFAFDSKKGKYSLETYLSIVGEYTDRLILSAEQENFSYTGGHCKVCLADGGKAVGFAVELYLADASGKRITKQAKRVLPANRFTTETLKRLKETDELDFNVERPDR